MKILKATDEIKYDIKSLNENAHKKSNWNNSLNYKSITFNLLKIQNEFGNDNDYRKHLERFLPQLEDMGWEHLFMDEPYN